MALTSELAVGKKISKGPGSSRATSLQPDQFGKSGGWMAQRIPNNTHCIEVAVETEGRSKVIRQIFTGKIRYRTHA